MEYKFYTVIRNNRKYQVADIDCIDCGKKRVVFKDSLLKKTWTNRCKICNAIYNIPKHKRGKNNSNWKGGRIKTQNGYIKIWISQNDPFFSMAYEDGYVLEHRYLMAKKLGRCLETIEQVHHLNGIKDDNRLQNLELLDGSVHFLITKLQAKVRELEERLKNKE